MNCLLQFKDKSHFKIYAHDLTLQVRKRITQILLLALGYIIVYIVSYTTKSTEGDPRSKYLVIVRAALIVLAIVVSVLLKRFVHRLKDHFGKLNFIFDLCLMVAQASFFPLLGNVAINDFDTLGVYVWAWSVSLHAVAVYFIFAHWWMKVLTSIIQMGYFLYFVIKRVEDSHHVTSLVLEAFNGVFLYLVVIYVQEQYQRKDFLEKRKIYENYEALMKIFDDISQGITIIDSHCNQVYSNRTIHGMFGKKPGSWTVEELLSEFQVKSIFPLVNCDKTPRISSVTEEKPLVILLFSVMRAN